MSLFYKLYSYRKLENHFDIQLALNQKSIQVGLKSVKMGRQQLDFRY